MKIVTGNDLKTGAVIWWTGPSCTSFPTSCTLKKWEHDLPNVKGHSHFTIVQHPNADKAMVGYVNKSDNVRLITYSPPASGSTLTVDSNISVDSSAPFEPNRNCPEYDGSSENNCPDDDGQQL